MAPPEGTDPAFARASVSDGAFTTTYWRSGAGASVVLLSDTGSLRRVLAPALASRFRVIIPEPMPDLIATPASRTAVHALSIWLRGFLDGLGLARVRLVADAGYAVAALGFILLEPERVEGVVLLAGAGIARAEVEGGLRDRLARIDRPLFVGCLDVASESVAQLAAIDEVVRFLDGVGAGHPERTHVPRP